MAKLNFYNSDEFHVLTPDLLLFRTAPTWSHSLLSILFVPLLFPFPFSLLVLLFTLFFRLFRTAHYLYVFTLAGVSKVGSFVCVMLTAFIFSFLPAIFTTLNLRRFYVLSLRFYLCVPYIFFNIAQGDSKFCTRSS